MIRSPNNPGYLRRTLCCLGLLILLQVLKKYLDGILPGTMVFHHFLVTGLQLIVLFWTITILLFPSLGFIKKVMIVFTVMALPELLCSYWLRHPGQIPAPLLPTFMRYSTQAENNILQYNRNRSRYDKDLFYTLRPSARFRFSNPEFADSFFTNSMGLRDDEASLQKPGIICLGDSYTMGWGVAQDESFAEQLGSLSHKKVLNAGVTSYGTPRELRNLYRLDTSNLRYIVLQYCYNDYLENESFVENGYSLKISGRRQYDSLVNDNYWSMLWFPGKRSVSIAKFYLEKKLNRYLFPQKEKTADSVRNGIRKAARYFTDILLHAAIDFNQVKVFVVDLNPQETMDTVFQYEVSSLMNAPGYAGHFKNNLVMVPLAGLLSNEDFFLLDPHIRPSGHRKIAERLYRYMFAGN